MLFGVLVLFKSPEHRAALAFWRVSLLAGGTLGLVPAGIKGIVWAVIPSFATLRLFGPALLALALVLGTTEERTRRRYWIWLPALVLLMLYPLCWWRPVPLFVPLRMASFIVLGGYILAACAYVALLWLRSRVPLQLLAIGLLGGLLPFLLFTLLPVILDGQALLPAQLSILALLLLPLSVGVAIVRTEFLGISTVLRRRALHLMLGMTLLVSVATAAGLLAVAGPQRWGWPGRVAALSALAALTCLALRPWLARQAERLLLHDVYDSAAILARLSDDLREAEPSTIGSLVAARLCTELDLDFVVVLIGEQPCSHCHPQSRLSPVFLEAIVMSALSPGVTIPRAETRLERIHDLPIHFLTIRDSRQIYATLCLSPKRSGDTLTGQDLELLDLLSRYLAFAFHNHHLRNQLAEQCTVAGTPPRNGELVRVPVTARELRIIILVADGHSNREIACLLERDSTTVEKHLTSLYHKLGVQTRVEAVAMARQVGILPPR